MENQPAVGASVDKLKAMVKERFGKSLIIRTLSSVDSGQGQDQQDFVEKGRDLYLPIRVNNLELGTVILNQADDLDAERRKTAAQLIRMVMEPSLYNWYLSQKQKNLEAALQVEEDLQNVEIFQDINEEGQLDDFEVEDFEDQQPELVSNFVFLQGSNSDQLRKVASNLSDLAHRWAFVPLRDLEPQIDSVEDLIELGAMTIYIEAIESCSEKMQKIVLDFLSELRDDKEPLIIASSTLSLSELATSHLESRLVDEMMVNTFEVERAPLDRLRLKEVLELFFFKSKESKLDS